MPLASLDDVLGHPLLILLAGTVLTGLLVPWLSARRQHSEKALELDVGLTETITEAVTSFVMAIQFVTVAPTDDHRARLNEGYHDFTVVAAVIGSKLETYHPASRLADEWTQLASHLERFYALTGITDADQHAQARDSLMEQLSMQPSGSETDDWLALKEALLQRMRDLNRRLLDDRGGARV